MADVALSHVALLYVTHHGPEDTMAAAAAVRKSTAMVIAEVVAEVAEDLALIPVTLPTSPSLAPLFPRRLHPSSGDHVGSEVVTTRWH